MREIILLLQSVFAFHRQQWGHFPIICPTGERIQVRDCQWNKGFETRIQKNWFLFHCSETESFKIWFLFNVSKQETAKVKQPFRNSWFFANLWFRYQMARTLSIPTFCTIVSSTTLVTATRWSKSIGLKKILRNWSLKDFSGMATVLLKCLGSRWTNTSVMDLDAL